VPPSLSKFTRIKYFLLKKIKGTVKKLYRKLDIKKITVYLLHTQIFFLLYSLTIKPSL
jgi:hypothetical protein